MSECETLERKVGEQIIEKETLNHFAASELAHLQRSSIKFWSVLYCSVITIHKRSSTIKEELD